MLVFYELNDVLWEAADSEFHDLVIAVADGIMDLPEITRRLAELRSSMQEGP
ncbi:hypothetical protein [Glutamicibacter creatinolyticus]|uniref:hypothetical protein n=1 Tax=Glutamicibacter creatinolyticus TaxID=162496 RepID=UPI0031D77BE3